MRVDGVSDAPASSISGGKARSTLHFLPPGLSPVHLLHLPQVKLPGRVGLLINIEHVSSLKTPFKGWAISASLALPHLSAVLGYFFRPVCHSGSPVDGPPR